jgi:photosystem II stability/assembly factor-like uncharacterized protein
MTLTLAASPSLASYRVTTTTKATARPAASATTWWLDSTWVSPRTGWVLGEGQAGCPSCAVIRYTGDGGITWSALPIPVSRPRDLAPGSYGCLVHGCVSQISFANREDGYLFDPDLYTTTDGGRTWHRQVGRPTVALVSVARGVVWRLTYTNLGCPGPCELRLLQQRAGSTKWTTVRAPVDGEGTGVVPQIVSIGSGRVLIARYESITDGSVAVGTFFLTSDQGRTWSTRRDPCAPYRAEDASVSGDGTLVIECEWEGNSVPAYILVSRNGGETYGPQHPVAKWNLFMVAAASASTIVEATGGVGGYGLGEDEAFTFTLERPTNGGATWRTVVRDRETLTSSTPGESYLGFVNTSVGHWIGFGNRLWTTTDGGEHWTATSV